MESEKRSNYIQVFGYTFITIAFAIGAFFAFSVSNIPFAILCVLLSALGVYRVFTDLKNGLRAPNRYEWFKYWMTLRPILYGLVVMSVIWIFAVNGRTWFGEEAFESDVMMITMAVIV